MNRSIFIATLCALALFAGNASAFTKLNTTRGDVDAQCGKGKSGCNRTCGSTTCHYHCDDKSKCTVTIFMKAHPGGHGLTGKPTVR